MMPINHLPSVSLLLLLVGSAISAEPTPIPLGHKDFYPSPARPVGFRGDGNGYFPGATPVSEWREGTVGIQKTARGEDLILTDRKAYHIVWKTEMPSWANTQPIVVGDRVFTTAEPNRLVCLDANSGKILWTAAANPWQLAGVKEPLADKIQTMYDIWRDAIPDFARMRGEGTMTRRVPAGEFAVIEDAFVHHVIPRIVKILKELDPQGSYDEAVTVTVEALRKYHLALAEVEKSGDVSKSPVGKHDPLNKQMTQLADTLAARINALGGGFTGSGRNRRAKVPLEVPWGHLIGFCPATPVSDGQFVYASFGQGQTVCYDLNGRRIWGVHYRLNPEQQYLSSLQSPLLVGDVLVDVHGGPDVLRGLDRRTGKLLWEAPTKGTGLHGGGGYYVGNHKVLRLDYQGRPVDVIVTTLCNIIRAADGRVLGSLPYPFRPYGGPSIIGRGNVVMKGALGDNYHAPYIAYRLRFDGPDRVMATEIWRTRRKSTPCYQSIVLTPAAIFMPSNEHSVLDPLTGKVLRRDSSHPIAGFSNTVAGKTLIWADDGSRLWSHRGDEVFGSFGTADVTDPSKVKILSTSNVLGGVNKPRVPAMEKYAPELYALKFYTGNAYGWPAHFLHTDSAIFPSGNRLFIRSLSHLYCIGDPGVPYDWNPASRPERVTRTLKDKTRATIPGEENQRDSR